jgi:hypothetical protein
LLKFLPPIFAKATDRQAVNFLVTYKLLQHFAIAKFAGGKDDGTIFELLSGLILLIHRN